MTWTLETIAVIAEWNGTAQVNTALVQRNPVRTIAIFDKVLRVQLVRKIRPLQQERCTGSQVRDVGFGLLLVKHTGLT
jgi:hypothetical protein